MDSKRQQKQEKIFADLLARDEQNKYCADCGQKGTGWASWNIGVFLCIKCASVHRKMGTHISKVKSTKLDSWTDDQLDWIAARGNTKMNQYYNPDTSLHPFPSRTTTYTTIAVRGSSSLDSSIEQFIRDKYERKLFVSSAQAKSVLARDQQELLEKAAAVNPYAADLRRLEEMGFKNQAECTKALQLHNGSLNATVEYLLKRKPAASTPMPTASTPTPAANYTELAEQLKRMGFTDEKLNRSILEKTKGKLGESVELLISLRQKSPPKEESAPEPSKEGDGWDIDAFEFNDFVSPAGKKPEPKPMSKNEIMSLFEDLNPATFEQPKPKTSENRAPEAQTVEASVSQDLIPKSVAEPDESEIFGSFSTAIPPIPATHSDESLNDKKKSSESSLASTNLLNDKLSNDFFSGGNPWA